MKTALLGFGLLLLLPAAGNAADDHSPPVCLMASSIESTAVIDEKTIVFRMRGGVVWKNTLRQSCPNLKFAQGFSQVIKSDQICSNQQIISVLGTGNTCQLGDFAPVEAAKSLSN